MKRFGFWGVLVLPFVLASTLMAGEVTLQWNANSEADLSGYNVYYGTSSRSYGPPVSAGKKTSFTVSNLKAGTQYYLAVTAVDTAGNESGYSKEIQTSTTDAAAGSETNKTKVDLWWTEYSNRSTAVVVKIYDGSTVIDKIKVNQRANGGRWNTLGYYSFKSTPKIRIVANGTGTACADAARITKPNGKKIVVDNGDANASKSGTWKRSYGINYYGRKSLFANNDASYTFKMK
jgi:fibronectin type 3 domain-containing protein